MPQRDPVQVLHHDERAAVVLPNFVNGADVGMVEGGGCPGFASKALQCLGVLGHVLGQKLQRHRAPQHRIFRSINHTHPTARDLFEHTIVRDGLVDHCVVTDSRAGFEAWKGKRLQQHVRR